MSITEQNYKKFDITKDAIYNFIRDEDNMLPVTCPKCAEIRKTLFMQRIKLDKKAIHLKCADCGNDYIYDRIEDKLYIKVLNEENGIKTE